MNALTSPSFPNGATVTRTPDDVLAARKVMGFPVRPAPPPSSMFVSNSAPIVRISNAEISDIAHWFDAEDAEIGIIEADGEIGEIDDKVTLKGEVVGKLVRF